MRMLTLIHYTFIRFIYLYGEKMSHHSGGVIKVPEAGLNESG